MSVPLISSKLLGGLNYSQYKFPANIRPLFNYLILDSEIDAHKSLTVKTFLESLTLLHLQVGLIPNIDNFSHELGLELDKHLSKVKDWGSLAHEEIQQNQATALKSAINREVLNVLEDRIRFLPHTRNAIDFDDRGSIWLQYLARLCTVEEACILGIDWRLAAPELFTFIEQFGGVACDPLTFVKRHFHAHLRLDGTAISLTNYPQYLKLPDEIDHAISGCVLRSHREIALALKTIYFSYHSKWLNSGTEVMVKGCEMYVSHHTVFDSMDFSEKGLNKHPNETYRGKLPFGIHPKLYCVEKINSIAHTMHESASQFNSPKSHILEKVVGGRQLVTGIDMVCEGNVMKHCVGGQDYLTALCNGERLFFHVDVSGFPKGATLSLRVCSIRHARVFLGDLYLRISEYYGFDDENILNASTDFAMSAKFALANFLAINFKMIPSNKIRSIKCEIINPNNGIPFRKGMSYRYFDIGLDSKNEHDIAMFRRVMQSNTLYGAYASNQYHQEFEHPITRLNRERLGGLDYSLQASLARLQASGRENLRNQTNRCNHVATINNPEDLNKYRE